MNVTDLSRRLFVVVLLSPSVLIAQGPPIVTDTPILLGLEGKAIMLRALVSEKSRLYRDGHEIPDSLNRSLTETTIPIVIPYNVRTRLLVGTILRLRSIRSSSVSGTFSSQGIGDIGIFAKYVLLQVDGLQETFRVAARAAAKFPTGSTDANPPLGSGKYDYSIGTVAAWIGSRFGLYGETCYSVRGSNRGVDLGDEFSCNVAIGFRLSPRVYETYPMSQWNMYVELLGTYTAKSETNGRQANDSGGNVILFSPGLQYIPSRVFLVEGSFQLPILQNLNGTQLGQSFSIAAGLRWFLY